MYLHCSSNKSTTTIILFYALCLLYALSSAIVVSDLVGTIILQVSNNPICRNINFFISCVQWHISTSSLRFQTNSQQIIFHLCLVQTIAFGCCDFIAQCILVCINHCIYHPFYSPKSSKIYRCWIVWGRNIRVVIIPSFMAIAFLGQSINLSSFNKLISIYHL